MGRSAHEPTNPLRRHDDRLTVQPVLLHSREGVRGADRGHVDDWLLWMRSEGLSERTAVERVQQVLRVAAHADASPDELTDRQVVTYLARAKIGQSTRAHYDSDLRAWFRWLIDRGIRDDDPMIRLKRPHVPRRRPRPVETAHLEQLLASRMHARTRTMILLAAYQGFRVHEIAKLRGEDVDLVGHRLYVVGKGGVDEWLPLNEAIAWESRLYPRRGWWFPTYVGNRDCDVGPVLARSVSHCISLAMARAGVPGTAHNIRHWYGTELVRTGTDLRTTQTLLRHASLQTTQIYVGVGEDRRTEAIGRLPRLGQ
jgi:integrase/recombinase XerD